MPVVWPACENVSDPTLVLSLSCASWKPPIRCRPGGATCPLGHLTGRRQGGPESRDAVHSASFSPDGSRIVTASRDGIARVWSADGTGVPILLWGTRTSSIPRRLVRMERALSRLRQTRRRGCGTPMAQASHRPQGSPGQRQFRVV